MSFDARAERNTAKYRRARRKHLAKHPLCAACHDRGIIRAATEIDHIVPVSRNPHGFWDFENNIQSLCRQCHEKKTAGENRKPVDVERRKWQVRRRAAAAKRQH